MLYIRVKLKYNFKLEIYNIYNLNIRITAHVCAHEDES